MSDKTKIDLLELTPEQWWKLVMLAGEYTNHEQESVKKDKDFFTWLMTEK